MKFKNPLTSSIERFSKEKEEHKLYEKIANDLDANNIDKGVWTKAFAKSGGDETKQKALYIELMIDYYMKEMAAQEELENIKRKEKEKQDRLDAALSSVYSEIHAKENADKEYIEKAKREKEKFLEEQRQRDADLKKGK